MVINMWDSLIFSIIKTVFVSMFPIVEIRGAIPYGTALGLTPAVAYIAGVIGNMLPIPVLVLFTKKVFEWLKAHGYFLKITRWLENKAHIKGKTVQKYSFWGLFILVAIPLPGTGAWMGALVASVLDMRLKKCIPSIILGVMAAGIIVLATTYGVKSLF